MDNRALLAAQLAASSSPAVANIMEHQASRSPYQQFQAEYPQLDQYGRKVASGGYLKENIQNFADFDPSYSPEKLETNADAFSIDPKVRAAAEAQHEQMLQQAIDAGDPETLLDLVLKKRSQKP